MRKCKKEKRLRKRKKKNDFSATEDNEAIKKNRRRIKNF